MKSYLLIIISAITLGITTALYKKSTAVIGPFNTTFFYYLFGTILSFIVWFFFKKTEPIMIKDLIYPGIIAVTLLISILTFNIGLQHTKLTISSTIRAFSFFVPIIIAVIFFREQLSIKQVIGIFLAVISISLMVS